MLSFYIRKGWGYTEDELVTTHPITSEVLNTHVAESIFDGITYSKGAATMKQLMYLIGEENFSKAIGEYFNKYKFKNTELNDLLDCIEKYFPPIKQWK
jgi:aminopeptidase N